MPSAAQEFGRCLKGDLVGLSSTPPPPQPPHRVWALRVSLSRPGLQFLSPWSREVSVSSSGFSAAFLWVCQPLVPQRRGTATAECRLTALRAFCRVLSLHASRALCPQVDVSRLSSGFSHVLSRWVAARCSDHHIWKPVLFLGKK